jgi:hypothetical protein
MTKSWARDAMRPAFRSVMARVSNALRRGFSRYPSTDRVFGIRRIRHAASAHQACGIRRIRHAACGVSSLEHLPRGQ